MRVTKVEIFAGNSVGLKPLCMDRLGSVVILAGKNGSGKTRLLHRLSSWVSEPAWPEVNRHILKTQVLKNGHPWTPKAVHEYLFSTRSHQIQQWQRTVDSFYNVETTGGESPIFAPFVPKTVSLSDPSTFSQQQLLTHAESANKIGVAELHTSTLARIQSLQNRWWNATHQGSKIPEAEREQAKSQYHKLVQLIRKFLNAELERDLDDHATLFGFPIGHAPLSDGQKILIQFCIAVHAQADRLAELIVLLDEPENHLHPGAMLDAIDQIQKALTNGQLWIATHSIPLLANFDPDEIWWMEDGGVEHAGSTPEKVLASLLGDDTRIDRLSAFLGLPAALAAVNFAFQCLTSPAVLNTKSNDPQTSQIAKVLTVQANGAPLRIFDLGAGRARLLAALAAGHEAVKDAFDYRAFDPDPTYESDCAVEIVRVYGTSEKRIFHEQRDVHAALSAASVDVVVMCNVLHEIDPVNWLEVFSEQGLSRILLRPDGFLLVVEDLEMRVGERAHQRGFLVLDTAGLRTLFQIAENEPGFAIDSRRDGRLKAHLIPNRCLGRANAETLKATLKQTRQLALEQIKLLRETTPSYRNGRLHAFHVQQLANAQLSLSAIGE